MKLRPPALMPNPLFNGSLITPILHLIDMYIFPWTFQILHLVEPDSYPTHETTISTPEGFTTTKRSRTKKMKKRKMKKER